MKILMFTYERLAAITLDDVAASFYQSIGIDPTIRFNAEKGRPITLVQNGMIIKQLFSWQKIAAQTVFLSYGWSGLCFTQR